MKYETTLKYDPKEFRNFYEGWITKSEPERKKVKRTHLLTAMITLVIALLIISSKNHAIQLVFLSILLSGVGIYHLIILFLVTKRFNAAISNFHDQLSEYLNKHQNTETMGLKITENEIEYFENNSHISTHSWEELTSVDYRDDHFMLLIGEPTMNILIPKFAVSEEFYSGVIELTKMKDVR
ncbi:MAG: hypothetical protein ABJE80_10590 [Reichenbachiella sp.]|uniref:hypothetical protein n=1 Tax=Reichenbachiella sp. TaxID=2184521 RepID=UPI003263B748